MQCIRISVLITASEGWKGTWRSPSPAHIGALSSAPVTDSVLAFLWTLAVEGSALFCSAAHPITGAHLTSGIFLLTVICLLVTLSHY